MFNVATFVAESSTSSLFSIFEWQEVREGGDTALAMFADVSRSEPPLAEPVPLNRDGSLQFSARSLSLTPLPGYVFPFKVMQDTAVRYVMIPCHVGRDKLGLNNNVTEQRRWE